jgi:hypothetical protein
MKLDLTPKASLPLTRRRQKHMLGIYFQLDWLKPLHEFV